MSLFSKKQVEQALAEVLEDGRAKMNEMLAKPKYHNYESAEPMLEIGVRVEPKTGPAFETKMKVGIRHAHLLKPGMRVQVKYDPTKKQQVTLDGDDQAILARNPQLIKQP